ncbi:MAG: DUF502 domain-containing protein [bacterium]
MARRTVMQRVRLHFGAGLLVLIPLFLTAWIVAWLFRLLSGILAGPMAMLVGRQTLDRPFPGMGWIGLEIGHLVPLVSILALVVLILAAGAVARNFIGQRMLRTGERLLTRIPVIRRIYMAVSQISEALLSDRKGVFRRAVLFEYPRRGTWSVGFVTSPSRGEVDRVTPGVPHYHIFLPTTPNPTSGYLLIVPQEECVDLEMSVEDALKLIISGGAVTPEDVAALESDGAVPAEGEGDGTASAGERSGEKEGG